MNSEPLDLDALTQVIRARHDVLVERHPSWASQVVTRNQQQVILIAMRQIFDNREDRMRVLNYIWPEGLDDHGNIVPLWSTNNLTKAQASVLINVLYGLTRHDTFTTDRPLNLKAVRYFSEMVNWTKGQPAEQMELI